MKPISLKLSNFMGHGESFIDFSKLPSASVIIGMEDGSFTKSNAVGKTTLFNAIRFALFDASVTKKAKVIRNGANKCEVEFVFELLGNKLYKIYRSRTKNTKDVKFFEFDGEWKNLSGRTDSYTEMLIVDKIKINQKTFENSSYFKQGDDFNLASTTAKNRKSIIRDLLHLHEWAKYETLAKEIRQDFSKELDSIKTTMDSLGDPKETISICQKNIKLSNYNITLIENDITLYSKELEGIKLKIINMSNSSVEQPELLKKLSSEKDVYNEIDKQTKFITSIIEKKAREQTTQKNFNIDNEKQLTNFKLELERLNANQIEQVSEGDYKNIEDDISKFKSIIRDNEARLKITSKSIPDDDVCPICYTSLDEDNRKNVLKEKQKRLNIINETLKETKANLASAQLSKTNLDNSKTAYNHFIERKVFLENKIINLTDLYEKYINNIEQIQEQLDNTKNELNLKEKQKQDSLDLINNLKEQIKLIETNSQKDTINLLKNKQRDLERQLSALKNDLTRLILAKGKLDNQLEIAKDNLEKLDNLNEQLKENECNLNVIKSAVKAFSSYGIPALIITTVLDGLQQETNTVLELLRPGIMIQFFIEKEREDGKSEDTLGMKFFVNNEEWDYEDLSGGQKACLALALKFAIAIINRRRCGADVRLLLLDEVDQALDQVGIDEFYNVIKKWKEDLTILIITHNEQLKNKFDSYILVNKENGITSAKVVI
jgi:DNA repair exonuclease SbcCD ATPase subunit